MIQIVFNPFTQIADLGRAGGNLIDDPTLETVVFISLFTHRLADPDDTLPDPKGDRQGWWADEYAAQPNDHIGSRLWLLSRVKATSTVPDLAKTYVLEALDWMIQDGVASRVDCNAEFQAQVGTPDLLLAIQPLIYRPKNPTPWSRTWTATLAALGA